MTLGTLARVSVALFALSTAFPVVAGVIDLKSTPRWVGIADVVVAAVMFMAVATVATRGRQVVTDHHRLTAFRVSQRIIGLIPALLVLYFIAGARINWAVLVIGLAWRAWLLLYSLPALVAALVVSSPLDKDGPAAEHDRSSPAT